MRMAPRVRSRAPLARTTAPTSTVRTPWCGRHDRQSVVVQVEGEGLGQDVDVVVDQLLQRALGELGAGELLAEGVQSEPGVDALVEDPTGLDLAVEQEDRAGTPIAVRPARPPGRPARRPRPPRRSASEGRPGRTRSRRPSRTRIAIQDEPGLAASLGDGAPRHVQRRRQQLHDPPGAEATLASAHAGPGAELDPVERGSRRVRRRRRSRPRSPAHSDTPPGRTPGRPRPASLRGPIEVPDRRGRAVPEGPRTDLGRRSRP